MDRGLRDFIFAGYGVNGDGWRFIKVDTHAPTLLNVAESKYQNYVEQSMQTPKFPAYGGADKLDRATFVGAIASKLGDPAVVSAIDRGFAHSWGNAGLMALFTNGFTPTAATLATGRLTAAQVLANPVLTMSKSPTGVPNNCQPPVIANPTGATGD